MTRKALYGTIVVVLALTAGGFWWRHHQPPAQVPAASASTSVVVTTPATASTNVPPPAFNFTAGLDAALLETNPARRGIAFGELFARWFNEDPEAALAYLRRMPRTEEFTQAFFYAAQQLATKDPHRALDLAQELATTHEQKYIYNALFDGFARGNLTDALTFLDRLPAGEARENAIRALTAAWVNTDVEAALAWSKNLTNETERAAAVETSLLTLATKDPWRTFELAQTLLGGDAQDRVLLSGLKKLLATNPQETADLISKMQFGPLQLRITIDAARTLADDNPARAVAWVQSLPGGNLQDLALNNVLDRWVKSSPAEAGQFIAQMEPGGAQNNAAIHFAQDYGALHHEDATRWAQTLTSEPARVLATVGVADGWARAEPSDAARWVTTLVPENPARDPALRATLSYWVLADAPAAGEFAHQLSAADQPAAIAAIGPQLAQQNPANALAWAQGFSAPASRQLALETVLARWRQNQPAEAARWAQANGF